MLVSRPVVRLACQIAVGGQLLGKASRFLAEMLVFRDALRATPLPVADFWQGGSSLLALKPLICSALWNLTAPRVAQLLFIKC